MLTNKTVVFLATVFAAGACGEKKVGDNAGAECKGSKCDNAADDDADGPALPCRELVRDFSGTDKSVEDIVGGTDPIAKLVLSGDGLCPMSVADIVEELRAASCSGHGSQLVSERSQLLGVFTDYRSVTELSCDDKQVFLHFPILAEQVKEVVVEEGAPPRLGPGIDAERLLAQLDHTFPAVIAEGEDGIFNYYQSRSMVNRVCTPRGGLVDDSGELAAEVPADARSCATTQECLEGEECRQRPDALGVVADFRFFGNSMDFVNLPDRAETLAAMAEALPGPVTTEADIEHSLDVERNCAVCHPGGGLTMREFDSPWVHWDAAGHFASPQAGELIAAGAEVLGRERSGAAFESTVDRGNREYSEARVAEAVAMIEAEESGARSFTTGDLLRPLFCTDEFNIGTTGSRPGVDLTSLRFSKIITDKTLTAFASIDTTHEAFTAQISREDRDWKLWGFSVGPFAGLREKLGIPQPRETLGTMTFIQRAIIDHQYTKALLDAEVIDAEFVEDVLSVDFTRAVFSEERCALIDVVDKVDAGDFLARGPTALAEALEVGGAQPGAEADFLANLQDDATDGKAAVKAFVETCEARDADAFLADYVTYVGQVRKRAAHQDTALGLDEAAFLSFRFPGANGFMMPDAVKQAFVPGLRFDPATCTLIDHYPGLEGATEDPEPPPAADGPCSTRECRFDPAQTCQCDAACEGAGDCCDDGPSPSCTDGE